MSSVEQTTGRAASKRHSLPKPSTLIALAFIQTTLLWGLLLFLIGFSMSPGWPQMLLIGLGIFVSGAHSGSSSAVVTEVNDPRIHATVLSVLALAISLLGMAPGPFIVGLLADFSELKTAMLIMPLASLLAGLCFLAANRHYRTDALRYQARPESSLEALEEEFMQLDAQVYSEKR